MSPEARTTRARQVSGASVLVGAALVVAFLTVGAVGDWSFVLSFRGDKLITIALVACAVPLSTVLFHTMSDNRILTPSIMGFDALFVLIQTAGVFLLGSARVAQFDPRLVFAAELGAMTLFSLALYRLLFTRIARSLELLLLVGVICGVLFRSLAGLLQRLIDPGEFLVLQDRVFASFSGASGTDQAWAAMLILGAGVWCRVRLPALDALMLGRNGAIAVGVDHRRLTFETFVVVTLLVAASTALVGPITFFGLLVANLAYRVLPGAPHRMIVPLAILFGFILLAGAQVVLERLLGFTGTVGMVVEFVGGILFILLLIGRR